MAATKIFNTTFIFRTSKALKYSAMSYRLLIRYLLLSIYYSLLVFCLSSTDRFNFVIHPSCMFIVHFKTLVQVVRFCSPIIALFHVFFFFKDEFDSTVIQWTTLFGKGFDVMLWLNIALKFFTAIEVSERQTYCKDIRKIMSQ